MSDDSKRKKSRGALERKFRPGGDARSTKAYKSDLEKLFKSGADVPERFKKVMKGLEPEEGTPDAERKAAIAALRKVEGFRDFAQAVMAFRKERAANDWAWPDEEGVLIRMLDHPDPRVVEEVLVHIADLCAREGFERTVALKSRLSTIRTMTDAPKTHAAIDEIEAAL
ncbi:hypothetical protein [Bradymonas sediminis]|uniref:Uncharacterized protein n=1 Tax=Bradymonas sediminis TaxID=1548548 RepID=A0A2Z4FNP0_9DELT|nr:hypothetical protein [Bradymonas sediminis]AWV90405.1 hypothetical protein DN745_14135 [Bradymonas sediminis]TDP72209.1 hypothetical protein DFR33_107191 [Bradymonas sediminis]